MGSNITRSYIINEKNNELVVANFTNRLAFLRIIKE